MGYLANVGHVATNTLFMKPEPRKVTLRDTKTHPGGPPWTRGTYEMVDYITVKTRWKNAVTNAESDPWANIPSDHYPVWANVRIKLKATVNHGKQRNKYLTCNELERSRYNDHLTAVLHDCRNHNELSQALHLAAKDIIPTMESTKKKNPLSDEMKTLICERSQAVEDGSYDKAATITKELRKAARRNKRNNLLEAVSTDLDVRDRWLGLRQLRKNYTPIPYSRRTQDGKHIPMQGRAEEAAKYLANEIWTDKRSESTKEKARNKFMTAEQIVREHLGIKEGTVEMSELIRVIKKPKRRKSAGPDEVPVEFLKEMDTANLQKILDILNTWWDGEHIPEEVLLARIVF